MRACHRCGTAFRDPGQPGFNNTCSGCGMPLHACSNCRHFVSRGSVRCLVPSAPEVMDPGGANRCEHFDFRQAGGEASQGGSDPLGGPPRGAGGSGSGPMDRDEARAQWDQLFGG